jgi:hypothetical protein
VVDVLGFHFEHIVGPSSEEQALHMANECIVVYILIIIGPRGYQVCT